MNMMALLLLLYVSHAHGHAFEPRATPVSPGERALVQNLSPVVTTAPTVDEIKAATSEQASQYPNTCGFVDGNFNEQVTCDGNDKCSVVTGLIGCCNAETCGGFYTTCYDSTKIGSTCSTCTVSEAQYCSDSYDAWCGTYYYPGSITDFQCSDAPATYTMAFNATTTYAPQNHGQPVPGATSTSSSSSSGSSPGYSSDWTTGLVTWQIAVISVGGFLAICALITCCYFYRRCMYGGRRRRVIAPQAPPPVAYGPGYPQSPPAPVYYQQTAYPNK